MDHDGLETYVQVCRLFNGYSSLRHCFSQHKLFIINFIMHDYVHPIVPYKNMFQGAYACSYLSVCLYIHLEIFFLARLCKCFCICLSICVLQDKCFIHNFFIVMSVTAHIQLPGCKLIYCMFCLWYTVMFTHVYVCASSFVYNMQNILYIKL